MREWTLIYSGLSMQWGMHQPHSEMPAPKSITSDEYVDVIEKSAADTLAEAILNEHKNSHTVFFMKDCPNTLCKAWTEYRGIETKAYGHNL